MLTNILRLATNYYFYYLLLLHYIYTILLPHSILLRSMLCELAEPYNGKALQMSMHAIIAKSLLRHAILQHVQTQYILQQQH